MYKHQHFEDLLSLEVQVDNENFTVEVHHFHHKEHLIKSTF